LYGKTERNETRSGMDVEMSRVRVTIFAVEKTKYYTLSLCVCNLSFLAYSAHVLCYVVICGLSGCTRFFLII